MSEVITTDNKSVEQLHSEVVTLIKAGQERVNVQLREIEERGKASEALGVEIGEINTNIANLQEQIVQVRADVNRPEYLNMGGEEDESVFARAMKDEKFKSFLERGYHEGNVTVHLQGFFPAREQTTITSATVGSSTAGILVPARVRDFVPKPERRFTMRDLLTSSPVANNAVEYIQENVFTNAASPQVEGSDKAEAALTFTIATANVRTIAHWIPATRQVVDDWAQLRRIIENKMLYGLKLKEEAEIISGSGAGQHLTGLTTAATAYAGTYAVGADTIADTYRHAFTELEVADEEANFLVINPVQLNTLLGIKDQAANVGNYVIGNPTGPMALMTLWGKPLIVTNSITAGYFLTGDRNQAEIFDRLQATVAISSEHSDYFTKNMVAIRVEERIALACYRAGAFRYGAAS